MWGAATRAGMVAVEKKTKRYPSDLTDDGLLSNFLCGNRRGGARNPRLTFGRSSSLEQYGAAVTTRLQERPIGLHLKLWKRFGPGVEIAQAPLRAPCADPGRGKDSRQILLQTFGRDDCLGI
jgi:hypothetical protein